MELTYEMHIVFENGVPTKWKNIKQTFIIKQLIESGVFSWNSLCLGFPLLLWVL